MASDKFVVRCDDYTSRPMSRASAERVVEIVSQGSLCSLEHEIVPVDQEVPMRSA